MATRMQQRRGTAAQWVSTNSSNGPILNAGEIGWESDTNKFKIGDGTNTWAALDYFSDTNSTVNPAFGSSITFEGATANDYETVLAVTDPTADRTITLPNVTGTVITTGNLSDITDIGVFTSTIVMEGSTANDFELTLSAGDPTADRTLTFPDATDTLVGRATTDTLTNKTLTSPVISSITNGAATLTLPTTTGTVALIDNLNTSLVDYIALSTLGDASGPAVLNGTGNLLVPGTKIIFEGDYETDNAFETELVIVNPTADVTITFPDATGTVAILDATQTFTNKTLTSPKINEDVAVTATATELNYVDGVTSAIQTQMDAKAPLASPALTGTATAVNLTISGNLTVDGTTTNINSTNLVVEDKNVVLGDTATPTDTTADGGGITLKGATDKTFNWVDATDAWTSSEHINLASGKTLKYNGTDLVAAQSGNSGKFLTTDGTATSWATVSGYSAPTLGSTSIASGATVTTISGLTDIVLNGPGSVADELMLLLMGAL
jgi:hypothetical protein